MQTQVGCVWKYERVVITGGGQEPCLAGVVSQGGERGVRSFGSRACGLVRQCRRKLRGAGSRCTINTGLRMCLVARCCGVPTCSLLRNTCVCAVATVGTVAALPAVPDMVWTPLPTHMPSAVHTPGGCNLQPALRPGRGGLEDTTSFRSC